MKRRAREIVVGVSGSRASVTALRWAAEEAERTGATLLVVLAWVPEPYAYYAHVRDPGNHDLEERAYRTLAAAVRSALGPDERANVSTSVVRRIPERALIEASATADLLVIGSESEHIADRAVGPVIRACLSRACCPVVVVSPGAFPRDHPDGADHLALALSEVGAAI